MWFGVYCTRIIVRIPQNRVGSYLGPCISVVAKVASCPGLHQLRLLCFGCFGFGLSAPPTKHPYVSKLFSFCPKMLGSLSWPVSKSNSLQRARPPPLSRLKGGGAGCMPVHRQHCCHPIAMTKQKHDIPLMQASHVPSFIRLDCSHCTEGQPQCPWQTGETPPAKLNRASTSCVCASGGLACAWHLARPGPGIPVS